MSNLPMPASTGHTAESQLAPLISHAFQLEETSPSIFNEAIKAHQNAKALIEQLLAGPDTFPQLRRKLFEQQVEVHQQRITHLQKVQQNGGSIVPSLLSSLRNRPTSQTQNSPLSKSATGVDSYTLTLSSSDLNIEIKERVYFFHLAQTSSPSNTIYGLQAIWSKNFDKKSPMVLEIVLRRGDEMFREEGLLNGSMVVSPDEAFSIKALRRGEREDQAVVETTASGVKVKGKKDSWLSSRNFSFQGRSFIWKDETKKPTGLLSKNPKWTFETLYETQGDGGAIVGDKLVYGQVEKGESSWTLFVHEGLSAEVREHVFVSQIGRFMWEKCPPKDFRKSQKMVAVDSAILLGEIVSKAWR